MTCNCDINLLSREGCKCGAFAEEQAKKITGIPLILNDYDKSSPYRAHIEDAHTDWSKIGGGPRSVSTDSQNSTDTKGVSEVSESYEHGRSYTHIQVPCDSIVWKNYLNCRDKDSLDLVINELRRHLRSM